MIELIKDTTVIEHTNIMNEDGQFVPADLIYETDQQGYLRIMGGRTRRIHPRQYQLKLEEYIKEQEALIKKYPWMADLQA